jgi:predicted nucleotidyltransferase
MSGPPSLEGFGAPAGVVAAIDRLREELAGAAGANLAGLILYGGLARGRYRPGRSDVNLVVLLHDATAASLAPLALPLRAAWRAARVEPMVLTPAEVRRAADVFPTKFLDIKEHHIVLAGSDPFVGLEVAREAVQVRVEQELRNLALRLRRRYLAAAGVPAELRPILLDAARPLALALAALLRLAGLAVPEEDLSVTIFRAAAGAFDLDGEALAALAALRRDETPSLDLNDLYGRVLESAARAAEVADRMEESP